jgi:hypothetical protein
VALVSNSFSPEAVVVVTLVKENSTKNGSMALVSNSCSPEAVVVVALVEKNSTKMVAWL